MTLQVAKAATPTTFTRLRAGIAGAMLAEFFGTFVLLLLGLGTCAVNVVSLPGSGRQTMPFGPDNWLINVFGWAFAVMLAAYVSGGISGLPGCDRGARRRSSPTGCNGHLRDFRHLARPVLPRRLPRAGRRPAG